MSYGNGLAIVTRLTTNFNIHVRDVSRFSRLHKGLVAESLGWLARLCIVIHADISFSADWVVAKFLAWWLVPTTADHCGHASLTYSSRKLSFANRDKKMVSENLFQVLMLYSSATTLVSENFNFTNLHLKIFCYDNCLLLVATLYCTLL